MAAKEKPVEVGLTVTMRGAESAEQFFARVEGRRGTRAPLDRALAAGRDALKAKLAPGARAFVEVAIAIVRAAIDDDPLGVKPAARVMEACDLLKDFGTAARVQAEHERLDAMPSRRQVAKMLAVCEEHGWSPRKRGIAKRIAGEMGITEHQARKYLRISRSAGLSQKRT